ncbi:hypothetical protein ACLBWT_18440 [Paenibacillus sp. D51F]
MEFDDPIPEFNEAQMLRLVQKDRYLTFVFKDLISKGSSESDVLQVLFNSNVIGDSVFTAEYEACAE